MQAEARFNIGGLQERVEQAIATSKGMRTQSTQTSARFIKSWQGCSCRQVVNEEC